LSWMEGTLGDLLVFQRGHDLPDYERKPGDIPVVGSAGVNGYHNVEKAPAPCVTIGRSGASIGKPFYLNEAFWPHNACLYVKDFKGNNPKFLFYLLGRLGLDQFNSGAAQPSLNRNFLYGAKVRYPDRSEQDRVAAILSAYDDLIENNRRRIALLEGAARQLYKEWFVRFRFPGHEHVKIVDGVPEGWERVNPESLFSDHIGGGWGHDEPDGQFSVPAYVLRGTDIPDIKNGGTGGAGVRYDKEGTLKSRFLEPGDVIFEVSGGSTTQPIARTLLILDSFLSRFSERVICASFCKRLRFSDEADAVFFHFHAMESRISGKILEYQKESASSLKNFNWKDFLTSYEIRFPPKSLRQKLAEDVIAILELQENLAKQNAALAKARDLLLPKLMNGTIPV
jgi:type I restriction enzyme S subunit